MPLLRKWWQLLFKLHFAERASLADANTVRDRNKQLPLFHMGGQNIHRGKQYCRFDNTSEHALKMSCSLPCSCLQDRERITRN